MDKYDDDFGMDTQFTKFIRMMGLVVAGVDAGIAHEANPGAHVFRNALEDYGLLIYGTIQDITDPEDRQRMAERPLLVMAECYSVACAYGELGTMDLRHVTGILTDTQMDRARNAGWPNTVEDFATKVVYDDPRWRMLIRGTLATPDGEVVGMVTGLLPSGTTDIEGAMEEARVEAQQEFNEQIRQAQVARYN